jgi:hypothetical protein
MTCLDISSVQNDRVLSLQHMILQKTPIRDLITDEISQDIFSNLLKLLLPSDELEFVVEKLKNDEQTLKTSTDLYVRAHKIFHKLFEQINEDLCKFSREALSEKIRYLSLEESSILDYERTKGWLKEIKDKNLLIFAEKIAERERPVFEDLRDLLHQNINLTVNERARKVRDWLEKRENQNIIDRITELNLGGLDLT